MLINKEDKIIYLTGEIANDKRQEINELCDFICTVENKVAIIINSQGGNANVATQIINAIQSAKCKNSTRVKAIVSGVAYSAAAIIAMTCSSLKICHGSSLMFHNTRISFDNGTEDNVKNFERYISHIKSRDVFLDSITQPFLTKEEIERQNNGEEIYINWDDTDLIERYKRHYGTDLEEQ